MTDSPKSPAKPGVAQTSLPARESESIELPARPADAPVLLTFRAAAEKAGVPVYQVRRAVRAGLLPTYRLYGGKQFVKWGDVLALIESSRRGGDR